MLNELPIPLTHSALAIAIMMFAVWLLSLWLKDASIVDVAWGIGFVVVAWVSFAGGSAVTATSRLLIPILTTVWGIRLSAYLFCRNHGKPEDYRYQAMREKWGDQFPIVSLLTVFALQGCIMWIVSLPVQVGSALRVENMSRLTSIGVAMWAVGLFFETVGDWQLARFKSDPTNKGRVLASGLWRYTRHPNYFGDFLVWWGLYLASVSMTHTWWTIVGPLTMSLLLLQVSGVTLLERSLNASKPEYAEYSRRTSAFFPWPPQRTKADECT
ncbi:MAG: DUF1295 domain-containing protein [Planctomycetales bacterium]|nr:DUF1295 domain-containing protein [Planctomycetales bacterium]